MTLDWIERSCPLCGETQGRVFAESNIDPSAFTEYSFASRKLPEYMHPRLVECSGCGLLYGNPVLSPDCLASLYRDAQFDSSEESQFASRAYARVLQKYLDRLPDRRGAIDIGAGDGAFCERLLELGFSNITGIEPSKGPIRAAKPETRPLLTNHLFEPGKIEPGSASLVTCFQVMEHLSSPRETAVRALETLKSGGLFLAVVHNQQALSAKILGTKSPIYDVEHLQLFQPETGRKLLERSGFENVEVYSLWNRYPLRYWLRLFPFQASLKHQLVLFAERTRIGRIPISLPAGNIVLAGFKPYSRSRTAAL